MSLPLIRYLILIFIISFSSNSYAKQDPIQFEKVLDLKQQLDGGFLKDKDGFLWIGTTNGLYRYDGTEVKNYKAGPKSLSGNWIRAIVEDKDGIIWIGTYANGITRYDKKKNTFIHFKHNSKDKNSISSNSIPYENQALFVDNSGALWVATQGGGLNRYDKKHRRFIHYKNDPENPNSISGDRVTAITQDKEGFFWIGTENAGLNRFNLKNKTWKHYKNNPSNRNSLTDNFIKTVIEDRSGILWVGTQRGGLCSFNRKTGRWKRYTYNPNNPNSISSNDISHIIEDKQGQIWIGHERPDTDISGLDILDKKRQRITRYSYDPGDPNSISSNLVSRMYEDSKTGTIWVLNVLSTIDKYDPLPSKFKLFQHNPALPGSLSANGVSSIYEDSRGAIWVGSYGGGLDRLNKETGSFKHYKSNPYNPKKLPYKWTVAMLEDSMGRFWVASQEVLLLFNRKTGNVIKRFVNNPKNPNSITRSTAIRSIIQDRDNPNILWLSTHGGGLDRFDIKSQVFTHYKHNPANPGTISHDVMRTICDDGEGSIWIPTFKGLNRLNKKKNTFTRYYHDPGNTKSISSNFLMEVYKDRAGNLWIVGKGGLSLFNKKDGTFKNYTSADGLPPVVITSIREDGKGNLWMGTQIKGIIRFNPKTKSVKFYSEADGLQSNTFWGGARFLTRDGQMWFGGSNGVNSFYPDRIMDNPNVPPIVITALKQSGQDMELDSAPEKVTEIELEPGLNYFEFKFAALNYTRPERNQYAYKLVGVDKDWYYSGNNSSGRYSNLPGGTYTLKLKGANNDGLWNEKGASIEIVVVPRIWQRTWFQLLLFIILIGGVSAKIRYRFMAVEIRKEELENKVAERTRDLERANKAKSIFLANMSHELRTPLNAILGYSQLIKRDHNLSRDHQGNLDIINNSGEHLLALISDVLEISKIEAGQIHVEYTTFNLITLISDLASMFDSSFDSKGIQFELEGLDRIPQYVTSDGRKIRQVLINLVGNAIKFTSKGKIICRVSLIESPVHQQEKQEEQRLRFEVEDTGEGIAKDELDKVFKTFEQTASGKAQKSGTGLGLAISQDYVQMLGGEITVTSSEDKGSCFSFEIPFEEGNESDVLQEKLFEKRVVGLEPEQSIPRILVAEDIEESRDLLVKLLRTVGFQVRGVGNGCEVLEIYESWLPNFIWMDIRMPKMDGFEAMRRIKETEKGKATVIVALTAQALTEERQEILAAGFDDFIGKPFKEQDLFDVMQKHLNVAYLTEDVGKGDRSSKYPSEVHWEQLSEVPEKLLKELYHASVKLDIDLSISIIEKICTHDEMIGNALRHLVDKLDYDQILSLLEMQLKLYDI